MRRAASLILGFTVGALAAAALLYYNPLIAERATASLDVNMILSFELPSSETLALTHGGSLHLPMLPPEIGPLWESSVSHTSLVLLVLSDRRTQPVAIATRVSKLSERSNIATAGLVLADDWIVTVPGRGSYALQSQSNLWPLVRDTVVEADYFGRRWTGPRRYTPTVGPESPGTARLIGATGDYRGAVGSAVESFIIDEYRSGHEFSGKILGDLQMQIRTPGADPSAQ